MFCPPAIELGTHLVGFALDYGYNRGVSPSSNCNAVPRSLLPLNNDRVQLYFTPYRRA